MFEKKKNYAQGEMRPLSAFSKKSSEKPVPRKNAPMQVPVSPQVQSTVSSLSEQNKITDAATVQQTPLRAAAAVQQMHKPDPIAPSKPEPKAEEAAYEMPEVYIPKPIPETVHTVRKPQPKPETKSEPKPMVKPEENLPPKPEPKPDGKPEIQSQPESIIEKKTEMKPESQPKVQPKRRVSKAPDLSNKAERDAYFNQFLSKNSSGQRNEARRTAQAAALYHQTAAQREAVPQNTNPFRNRPADRPVISHAKEEPSELSVQKPVQHEEPAVEPAPASMTETIEQAAMAKRQVKKAKEAQTLTPEMKRAQVLSASVRTVALVGAVLGCGLFLLLGERSAFSAEENRKLAAFPEFSIQSYLNGEYTAGISSFYNDTVPMRSTFKRAIASMETLRGLDTNDEENVVFFGNVTQKNQDTAVQTNEENQNSTEAPAVNRDAAVTDSSERITEMATEAEEPAEPPVEVGDSIVIYNKRAISFYGGGYGVEEEYANVLNDFKAALPDVNVYSMIAPTAVSFYLPEEYQDYTASEKENIDRANSCLDGVTPVDVYSVLEAHQNEEIYARTDHHWLPLGAYYAAQTFAKTADVPFTDISQMDSKSYDDYVGSMYTYTSSPILSENPETFTYYIPKNAYTVEYYDSYFNFQYEDELLMNLEGYDPVNYYLVFMGGDDKIVHISTDTDNDRTLVIFKDSYGNAMVPCLVGSFSEIYVCDMRYFYLNAASFCEQVGATDLLFAMNTFSATGGNEDYLEQILYYQ